MVNTAVTHHFCCFHSICCKSCTTHAAVMIVVAWVLRLGHSTIIEFFRSSSNVVLAQYTALCSTISITYRVLTSNDKILWYDRIWIHIDHEVDWIVSFRCLIYTYLKHSFQFIYQSALNYIPYLMSKSGHTISAGLRRIMISQHQLLLQLPQKYVHPSLSRLHNYSLFLTTVASFLHVSTVRSITFGRRIFFQSCFI